MHPLRSLGQTIDWCDLLSVEEAGEDALAVEGADLPEGGENLVWRAVEALRKRVGRQRPQLLVRLSKRIPVAAGLGGGSADAAATLLAVCEIGRIPASMGAEVAPEVGADVAFFLTGGLAWMEGHGERVTSLRKPPHAYAVAVAVPPFELSTAEVYRKWDELEELPGAEMPTRHLPPSLRELGPFANDLYPAARELRPELGDWSTALTALWGRSVLMTGSGPALFAFFTDLDEAASAAVAVKGARACLAARPRARGAGRTEEGG
jgi:4-diphosphocytidyl-2-C-methyl-D-erythritol kinase